MKYYKADEFDINFIKESKLVKRKRGKQKSKKLYKNLVCAFDIEATNLEELNQAVMYIWQMQIEEYTIIGRTWKEWLDLLERIADILPEDVYLVIYIHNASYEFQFIRGVYSFDSSEVFATERRRILKFEMFNHFEFRCSYYLTNSSLDKFLKKMDVENKKLNYDYSKRRFSFTKLTEEELDYCINDVKGLVQAIRKKLLLDGDTLATIPLTATGYPRKDLKQNYRGYNMFIVRDELPDLNLLNMLAESFRGGNTHANRWYAKEILTDVYSYDRVSSYPDVMLNKLYPVKKFIEEKNPSVNRLKELDKRKRPYLMRVILTNVKLKDKYWGCPYLTRNKSRMIKEAIYDNGRIIEAEMLETTINDIDWKIIISEYDIDEVVIKDLYSSKYGKLPIPVRNTIKKYFIDKSALKHSGNDYEYDRAKGKLNACYGMMVEYPLKNNLQFIDNEEGDCFIPEEINEEEALRKHNKKAYLNYAWGCWVSSWARLELEEMIREVVKQGGEFLYCDTDSVKFFGDVDFTEYNKEHYKASIKNGAYAPDKNGEIQVLGILEEDGIYKRFKTNGAKKYAYEDKEGKLHITIAGVNKVIGAEELAEAGGLTAMEDGFTFKKGGGTESVYNDKNLGLVKVKEGKIDITSNIFIRNSEYTLGSTADYISLLTNVKKLKYSDRFMPFIYDKKGE